jgi:(E)-4-hydroxy-3-methylbut-2-enyl-diphosphate synthase
MAAALSYCPDLYRYQRRATREVNVGTVGVGGTNPIRVQSMLTCDTMDTAACIQQTVELVAVGCEIVRITAPTVKDAANLEHIVAGLRARGCTVPIVADIHFKPQAALEAAKWVEKVRINPGNYADSKKFKVVEYTDAQYAAELDRIRERFTPLVIFCREHGRALRIGTNHGSLSDRIMNRYGDTPLGMVESALEFARIARDLGFHAFIFSMKASNPKVMIEAYRLLVARLDEEDRRSKIDEPVNPQSSIPNPQSSILNPLPPSSWSYPIHLGVTEAGDGEDGRIKSAIGIGSLLSDGIGDTIRVSLTEDSIHEVPVARALIEMVRQYGRSVLPA